MRVVAGTLRGRKLRAVPGEMTRPTADRVKEALFSILGPLDGAEVLDLYAGTGALGIEAISRGAAHALCVERAREAVAVLKANVEALSLADRVTVLASEVARAASTIERHGPFDLVFVDPPYEDIADALVTLGSLATKVLGAGAVVIVEHATREKIAVPGLTTFDTRKYGSTSLAFLRAAATDG